VAIPNRVKLKRHVDIAHRKPFLCIDRAEASLDERPETGVVEIINVAWSWEGRRDGAVASK
jgi:hypothetical protein